MKYRISHRTSYTYLEPVTLSHHQVHLIPRQEGTQTCLHRELRISPAPAIRRERIDSFGNRTVYFSIEETHQELVVVAESEIAITPAVRPPSLLAQSWEEVRTWVTQGRRADILDAYAFTFDSPYVKASEELARYGAPSFAPGRSFVEGLQDLTHRIFVEFRYDPKATSISTPVHEVLQLRRGVCQDFAHLMIGCLRSLGLPARYVSGYLSTDPPPGRPRLVGADASHAWVSAYLPEFGWVDFDPTNDVMPSDRHIIVAYGRDFGDVTPVRGVILGGRHHDLKVSVDARRLDEPTPVAAASAGRQ